MSNLCKLKNSSWRHRTCSLSFSCLGFVNSTSEKVTVDHHCQYPVSSSDGSISLETTYVIPGTKLLSTNGSHHDSSNEKKIRFLVPKQSSHRSSVANGNMIRTNSKFNEMTQRKNLSFVDAVNGKHLDLSTGLLSSLSAYVFSSPSSSSSSPFSSSTSPLDQHRHPHNHFSSSSSSPPHTTTIDNKNRLSTLPLSVNNHHHPPPPPPPPPSHPVGSDSSATTTITLKEAIDANILDAQSAYVVDTLEQR